MDKLIKQVAQARRRLILVQFLTALAWCWTAALLLAAAAIGVAKLFPLDAGPYWAIAWLGGAMSAGLLAAGIWTWITRPDPLLAAIELDHRFALKERVSSALALTPAELQTDVGQALVGDAVRRVQRLDVPQRFGVPLRRLHGMPLLPALLAFGLTFFADRVLTTTANANSTSQAEALQVQHSAQALARKFAQLRKEAPEKGLKDAGDLFQKIEEGTKDLAGMKGADRKEALVKLNDLAKDLEARREKIGGTEQLKQQLKGMKDSSSDGPADKLAQDMKNGNFNKALDEIKKLQNQLASDKLDAKQREDLAQQLNSLKDALDKVSDKHDAQQQALQKQIDQLKNAGKTADANRLQKQLDQLQQQQPQMQALKQMAQKLGQTSKSLSQGKQDQARESLGEMARGVEQLKQQGEELKMLDQALDQIADAKESMCQGKGDKPGDGKGGDGLGEGGFQPKEGDKLLGQTVGGGGARAEGQRPERATGVKFYDSKVGQKIGKGAAVITGETDGPNVKGQVRAKIQEQIDSARHESADPLIGQRLPRSQRDYAREYFNSLRDGE